MFPAILIHTIYTTLSLKSVKKTHKFLQPWAYYDCRHLIQPYLANDMNPYVALHKALCIIYITEAWQTE